MRVVYVLVSGYDRLIQFDWWSHRYPVNGGQDPRPDRTVKKPIQIKEEFRHMVVSPFPRRLVSLKFESRIIQYCAN